MCFAFGATAGHAAPGTLSDSPLFLTNAVEPNILFLVDDSGSMDWGLMTGEESGVVWLGNCPYYYSQPTTDNDDFWVVPTEEGLAAQGIAPPYGGVWRTRNRSYNRAYYDPRITYTPWPGENSAGVAFGNVNPMAAPVDPYQPASGTVDLTAATSFDTDYCPAGIGSFTINNYRPAYYYEWTDSDGDGAVDADDAHRKVEISPVTPSYQGSSGRSDCAAAPLCSYAEEIQNFANWFSYYRKRELVAKAAYGQVVADASNARMGLVSLHDNNDINSQIRSMNDDPRAGNKKAMLDSLYGLQGASGTPLRNALNEAGKYLSCESNEFFGSCPALPPSNGGECQQNFTLMMTDGFYNGAFAGDVGNADGDNDTQWDSGPGGPYGDGESLTLADVAMEYYENDIRPGVDNNLAPPASGADENRAQHMVTYSVAFGVDGDIDAMPANDTDPFAWPAPVTDPARIDDLRHAAWNGRGDFLSAQDPGQLISGLRGALTSIQSRTGSSSSVAFNTGSLSTTSQLYLALFNSEGWAGELLAYRLDATTGDIATVPKWAAGERLTARDTSTSPRNMLTFNGNEGIPLQWNRLTAEQKADLRTSPSGATDTVPSGMARLAHLRGDRSCESGSRDRCDVSDGSNAFTSKSLRNRNSRLGDIVHSGPVFAGTPESNWPDVPPFPSSVGTTYTEFRAAQATRPGVVFVGGNDGMLHAFSESNGEELFTYVPNALFSTQASGGLHYLSDPGYSHRYAVDLTASIADVYAKTNGLGTVSWKTVLVGGLRGGGRGLFALDITRPDKVSEAGNAPAETVMWEFTSADDPDLGHTFSRPSIVPLEGSSGSIRWGVVFGNGYNDLGSGEAKLFILFLEEGLDGNWTAGSDYVEITTGVGDPANRNGLSTPAVIDTNGDGLADRAYAGDLEGNMWAFDLSGNNPSRWEVAYQAGTTPKPLYVSAGGQPITSSPVIVRNKAIPTKSANAPNTLVIFGTGQYLTVGDITTTDLQSVVGVWDSGDREITQADLVEQFIGLGATSDGTIGRTLTMNSVDYSRDHGWFIDLPVAGERQVTDPVIRGDLVFFNTTIPNTNPCDAGGTSWQMVADWQTGGAPTVLAFDLNGDIAIDDDDRIADQPAAGKELTGIAAAPVALSNKLYTSTTQSSGGSTISTTEIVDPGGVRTGRLSWEELNR